MIYETESTLNFIDNLPRLTQEDVKPDYRTIRVIACEDCNLVNLKDFIAYKEQTDCSLADIERLYNIDNSKFYINEADAFDTSDVINYMLENNIDAKDITVNPLYTKPIEEQLEESIQYFIDSGSWDAYDFLMEANSPQPPQGQPQPSNKQIIKSGFDKIKDSLKKGFDTGIQNFTNNTLKPEAVKTRNNALKWGIGIPAFMAASYGASKLYANRDSKKDPAHRSELIKRLRVLRGKLPEYEGKYEQAKREDFKKANIFKKIIIKIKETIQRLVDKIRGKG